MFNASMICSKDDSCFVVAKFGSASPYSHNMVWHPTSTPSTDVHLSLTHAIHRLLHVICVRDQYVVTGPGALKNALIDYLGEPTELPW